MGDDGGIDGKAEERDESREGSFSCLYKCLNFKGAAVDVLHYTPPTPAPSLSQSSHHAAVFGS